MKLTCCGCGSSVEATQAKTLDRRLVENKDDLIPPVVSAELLQIWLKVAKSRPGVDAVCPVCSEKILAGIVTIKVKSGALGGLTGLAPLAAFTIPKEKPVQRPRVESASFVLKPDSAYPPAAQVALAIKRGERIAFAKREDRRDRLTPCIVSVNVSDACDRLEDWRTMRTLQSPKDPCAHFAFCDTCREIVSKCLNGDIEFGVTLFEAITSDKPAVPKPVEASKVDNVIPFPAEPVAEIVPIGVVRERREWTRPPARRSTPARSVRDDAVSKATCSVASQIVGYPNDRMEDVPVFIRSAFGSGDLCFDGLFQTTPRYDDLVRMHGDSKIRRGSPEWDSAKAGAKACKLHGLETRELGKFRANVIQHIQENWPEEWRQRSNNEHVGKHRCSQCSTRVNLLFDPAAHRPVQVKEGEPVVGVCGACNKRISRDEKRSARETALAVRRQQDAAARLAARGKSDGGGKKK